MRVLNELPLSLRGIRALGFEATGAGWIPRTKEAARRVEEADGRRFTDSPTPGLPPQLVIPPDGTCCLVCGGESEPSTVGTPTCSEICLNVLMRILLPKIAERITREGPLEQTQPPKAFKWPVRDAPGEVSVSRALENVGSPERVLQRHKVRVAGKKALCPAHPDTHPSLSLYTDKAGRGRVKCHACGWGGDAIDLEAMLSDRPISRVIKEFS